MPSPLGATFAPGEEQNGITRAGGPANRRLSPSALQVLALNLPRFISARATSPADLLRSQGAVGAGSNPDAAVIQSLLSTLGLGSLPRGPAGSESGDLASMLGRTINLPATAPTGGATGSAPLQRRQRTANASISTAAAPPRVSPIRPRPEGAPPLPTPDASAIRDQPVPEPEPAPIHPLRRALRDRNMVPTLPPTGWTPQR